MKKIFLQSIILFISLNGFSQSTNYNDVLQIYPPNAYALARYGDIPVDYSTGVPDISVPLISISDKDITVNLSLSYHATGIKVDQEATWVGLGWVLNAGGVITRDIRDEADSDQERPIIEDFEPDYSNYNKSFEQYLNKVTPKIAEIAQTSNFYDGESDIYYYNFCGRSGKFFLDNNNNICLFKHDDIIIDKKTIGKDPFTITDDSGIKYTFNETGYVQQGANSYITSWYLTKIISPAGGEISFEYENLTNYNAVVRNKSMCFIDASTTTGSLSVDEASNNAGSLSMQSYIYEPLLSRITTKSGFYINLSAPTGNRKDFVNSSGRMLKNISLYNERGDPQKGIELKYEYFEANTNRRYKDEKNKEVNTYNFLNYRLRLESVNELSKSNEDGYTYKFKYFGDDNPVTEDVYTLPYRLSPCQDHWGYFNNSYNKTIFPGTSNIETDSWFAQFVSGYESIGLSSYIVNGANREPNAEAAKAGTLNKIIYPTGGYTQFDFEVNGDPAGTRGGLRIKQIETCDNNGNTSKKNYTYSGIVEDLVYIDFSRNYYHTYLYNPILYSNTTTGFEDTHNLSIIRNALGIMGVPPDLVYNENYNKLNLDCKCGTYLRVVKINGMSPLRLGLEGETAYSKVTEVVEGLGKTEYYYTNISSQFDNYSPSDDPVKNDAFFTGSIQTLEDYWSNHSYLGSSTNSFTFPFPSYIDYGWKSKLLNCKRVFDLSGNLVNEDSVYYQTKLLHTVPNFKAVKVTDYNYTYTRTYNIGGIAKISKEVNRQYMPDGRVIQINKEYDYLSPYHKKVTEKRTILSQEENEITKYYYPQDYGNYFDILNEKNIIAPIDIRSYKRGKLVSGKQIEYNGNGQPIVSYNAESNTSDINFNVQTPFTFTPYLWNSYDPVSDNLQTQKSINGINTSYLWGYNQTCPIAVVKNASQNEIYYTGFDAMPLMEAWTASLSIDNTHVKTGATSLKSVNGSTGYIYHFLPVLNISNATEKKYKYSGWVYSTGPSANLYFFMKDNTSSDRYAATWNAFYKTTSQTNKWVYLEGEVSVPANMKQIYLRVDNNSNGTVWFDDLRLYPSDAQMKTYTYTPLVGMTSSTDENNQSTYYEYDDFGRLKNVRDKDNNIIKRNYYHYYNETTSDGICTLDVSGSLLRLVSSATSVSFSITSGCHWTISENASWLTLSQTSGSGNATITVNATANNGVQREATITVSYGSGLTKTISVRQSGALGILTVDASELWFGNVTSLTNTIQVTTNTSWVASGYPAWLTIQPASGTGNASVKITATKLVSGTRTGTITFTTTDGSASATLLVTQSNMPI